MVAKVDARLVRRVLRGDRSAFAELVGRHQARMLAAANHLAGDPDIAQDLVQESFVEAYRGLGGLREPGKFGAWLYGILRIRCRRYLSRRPPQALSWEADDVPEPAASNPVPEPSELIPFINELPQESREVLAARYLLDMNYAEIADMLGISAVNVRVKCFRARQALRDLLSRLPGSESNVAAQGGGW